jgi:hypothetical protein
VNPHVGFISGTQKGYYRELFSPVLNGIRPNLELCCSDIISISIIIIVMHDRVIHLETLKLPDSIQTTIIPTTTYPFSFTTAGFSGTASYAFQLPFTTPTASPTVIPFEVADNCCSRWSQYPANPIGLNASCSISLSRCDNPHAFWDLYTCCNGAEPQQLSRYDNQDKCAGTCQAVGQTWQELMSCLTKRAAVVVCKPDSEEIGAIPSSSPVVWQSTNTQSQSTSTGGLGDQTATHVPAEISTGAASSVDVVDVRVSKAAVALFAVLAVGSAAGMFI